MTSHQLAKLAAARDRGCTNQPYLLISLKLLRGEVVWVTPLYLFP